MDGGRCSKHTRGHSSVSWILLLGCCLAGVQASAGQSGDTDVTQPTKNTSEAGLGVFIVGPDYVTVGVPCSFECIANCPPSSACTYSMALDQQASSGRGNVLAFKLLQWADSLTLSCTSTDDITEVSETTTKKLQVLAGPANVSITGPALMSPMASHSYICHAYCRPSCNYTWKVVEGAWVSGQGNVITVTPKEGDTSKTLTCKATNIVSGLFATRTQDTPVMSGPSEVRISGPDRMVLGSRVRFVCAADCVPACRYMWTVGDHTLRGSEIEITVDRPMRSVTLKCEVQNTLTRRSMTGSKTVWLEDHSGATHPEDRATLLLSAFIVSAVALI